MTIDRIIYGFVRACCERWELLFTYIHRVAYYNNRDLGQLDT